MTERGRLGPLQAVWSEDTSKMKHKKEFDMKKVAPFSIGEIRVFWKLCGYAKGEG